MGKFDEGKLPTDPHLMLRLAIETVAHDYDVIVIDSAPNLGIGTINVVCAADVLIVPTPAELFDYTSALQFFDMLRDLLKNVDLKGFEPDVRILLTKYSNSNGSQSPWMEEQIRDAWGSMVLKMLYVKRMKLVKVRSDENCLNRPLINALQLVPGEMLFLFGNLSAMKFSIV